MSLKLRLGWDSGQQQDRVRDPCALPAAQVPIIRNRSRALVVIESPWDSFGPTPPASESFGGQRFEDGNAD